MGRGLNKVMLIGRLGKNPIVGNTTKGKPMSKFNIANTRTWTSASGKQKEATEWFNIVAWGKLAEICNLYLKKGSQVYIEGRLQTLKWEDEKGKTNSKIEIVANELIMLGNKKEPLDGNQISNEDLNLGDGREEYPF
jgi:single-strand DNA-binding protein